MPSVFTVLASIPWGQVVEHAPKLAQGAARLWENVRKRQAEAAPDEAPAATGEVADPAQLAARTRELQAQVQTLQEEMRASAEMIKELAEQNALLIQRMEAMHARLMRLVVAGGVCLAALGAALAYLLAMR